MLEKTLSLQVGRIGLLLASLLADRKVVGSNPTRSGRKWRGGCFEAGVGVGVGVAVGVGVVVGGGGGANHGIFGAGEIIASCDETF